MTNFDDGDSPVSVYGCQRNGERHRVLYAEEAFVEFVDPFDRLWRFELLGISSRGICFGLDAAHPTLERGSRLDRIVLQIAKVRIDGSMTIAHSTEEFASGTICGGQFDSATAADERKLAEVIAKMGW
jgi:hypothetical protein